LLKEIMTECESFHTATAVSIEHNKANGSWELRVSWAPHPSENECLEKIVAKHSLEMITTNERTVFR
jgi:hypothetical protein